MFAFYREIKKSFYFKGRIWMGKFRGMVWFLFPILYQSLRTHKPQFMASSLDHDMVVTEFYTHPPAPSLEKEGVTL